MKYFVTNKNIALSREQLLTNVWGYDFYGDDRTIDTHVKTLRKNLGSCAKVICLFVFYLIFISALKGMFKESYGASIMCIPFLFCLYILCKKNIVNKIDFIIKIQILAHIISFALMIYIAIYGCVEYSWDWGQILRTATSLTLEGVNDNPEYYLRYPNNQFWLSVMTRFFSLLHKVKAEISPSELKIASMLLSIMFVRISCVFCFLSFKELFGNEKARILDAMFMLYLPLHLYSYFAYTDTSGLFCVSIMIYLFLRVQKSNTQRYKCWLLLSVFAFVTALVVQVKIMGLIIFIGMLLSELLNSKIVISKIVKKYIFFLIMFIAFTFILQKGTNSIIKLDLSQSEKYEFPPIHWVMMGMNETGGYNQGDVDYAKSLENYDSRNRNEKGLLIERIQQKGTVGTLKHIFDKKMMRTWGNSLLGADDYISRKPIHFNSFAENVFGQSGKYHGICLLFSWMYHIAILLGCLLSVIFTLKKKKEVNFLQLSIVGICIFLSIWECNSRYLFVYIPVMYMCAADGWFCVKNIEKDSKKKEKQYE